MNIVVAIVAFGALTLLVGRRPVKNGGWWRWALLSPDGVAPSRMVSVSTSVSLPLHHKVQKFSSGTGSPGCSRKKSHKTAVVVVVAIVMDFTVASFAKQLHGVVSYLYIPGPCTLFGAWFS